MLLFRGVVFLFLSFAIYMFIMILVDYYGWWLLFLGDKEHAKLGGVLVLG